MTKPRFDKPPAAAAERLGVWSSHKEFPSREPGGHASPARSRSRGSEGAAPPRRGGAPRDHGTRPVRSLASLCSASRSRAKAVGPSASPAQRQARAAAAQPTGARGNSSSSSRRVGSPGPRSKGLDSLPRSPRT